MTFTDDVFSAVGVPPAGNGVLFYANGVLISGQPVNGELIADGSQVINGTPTAVGVDTFTTSALPAGNVKVTAVYTDLVDGNYATSTGTINAYPVTKAPTAVSFNGNTTPKANWSPTYAAFRIGWELGPGEIWYDDVALDHVPVPCN